MSVYFITCRDQGVVKIGTANDPIDRLSSLQTAAPGKLRLEATLAGSLKEERALHERFAAHRTHGEWFTITDEIDSLIRATGHAAGSQEVTAPASKRKTIEELVEESLREEREAFAENMRWRARCDAGEFDLPQPESEAA